MSALPVSPDEAPVAAQIPRATSATSWRLVAAVGLAAIALAVPFALSDYRIFLVTMTLITAIAVLGLNMLVGYNGQLSLGHGALYALGAYVTAVLMEHGGFAWWATLPVSALVCFGFGQPNRKPNAKHTAADTGRVAHQAKPPCSMRIAVTYAPSAYSAPCPSDSWPL